MSLQSNNYPSPADHAQFHQSVRDALAPTVPASGDDAGHGVKRTADDVVLVTSKALVMQVFQNADGFYSVSGYLDRGRRSIGEIYLCLDAGSEYDRLSDKTNRAIQGVSAEAAFGLALAETRSAVASLGHSFDLTDLDAVLNKVLAAVCTPWFDLPDGNEMIEGGMRLGVVPPTRCPGDFASPSGFIFNPEPNPIIAGQGQAIGPVLRAAATRFVAALRSSGGLPAGTLSRVIFDAFPDRSDDDLVARTIIGVMMGMLPTVYFNLDGAVKRWWPSTFQGLQHQLKASAETDPFKRAMAVLRTPLIQAIQQGPVPGMVWRTATAPHKLGPVDVKPGDKIYIDIGKAMAEDFGAGVVDPFPVFGGDRSKTPHPTHACPGHAAAMGVMLGTVNGMLEP